MVDAQGAVELGHVRSARRVGEDNWALKWPQSVRVYTKMFRQDSQVQAIVLARSLPIQRATWRVDPNGADPEVVDHVAGDLRLPVLGESSDRPKHSTKGRVSWKSHLERVLHAQIYGHAFFEQVYRVGSDGREHLHKLAPRPSASITNIRVASDGGLEGIEQLPAPGRDKPVFIPVDRLVAYVHSPMDDSWQGSSILRPAYKHWVLKDRLLELEDVVIHRNGMGVAVYTGSDSVEVLGSDMERGEEIARTLAAGESSGAFIPNGAKLEVKGTQGQLVSPRQAIEYHDLMMAKGVLANVLNLEGGGSYALSTTYSDFFVQSLQTEAEWIADVANQHIVEDLVQVAFPGYSGPPPQIMFDPIASKKDLTPGDLALLINAKLILPDADLEEEIRRRYALPAKRPLVDALKSKQARLNLEEQMGVTLSDEETAEDGADPAELEEGTA